MCFVKYVILISRIFLLHFIYLEQKFLGKSSSYTEQPFTALINVLHLHQLLYASTSSAAPLICIRGGHFYLGGFW
jgi:hypothetical protein